MVFVLPGLQVRGENRQAGAAPAPAGDLERAETLVSAGRLDEAITLLEGVRQNDPNASGLEARLGKVYYKKRDFQQALPHLRRALELNPEDIETTQLLGLSYYSTGQLSQAIPLLERIQPHLPATEFDGLYLLGVCYLRTQQQEKARALFARMFSAPSGSATAHLLFAQMMVRQHLEDQAVPELEKAVSLDPRLPMVHFLLGEIYVFQSSPERALEEFQKELAISPTLWLVYWRLGDTYARLGKYPEAERALKQAIWLNETFTGPYVSLGQIGLKKGDLELALGFLERATKMDPNNYYAHYYLAKAYQQAGRSEEAKRQFDLARSLLTEKKNAEGLLFENPR